jgi:hypothetical protein
MRKSGRRLERISSTRCCHSSNHPKRRARDLLEEYQSSRPLIKFLSESRPRERDADGQGRLVISFETRALRTVCRDSAEAQALYGDAAAAALRRVLADLRAANTMFDVAPFFDLPTGASSEFSTPLAATRHLVLRCGEKKPPLLPSGNVDWNSVDRVRVLDVIDNG